MSTIALAAASFQNYLNYVDVGLTNLLTDPGNGGAIPVTTSGTLLMDCAGTETRTLADPSFAGQRIDLVLNNNSGVSVTVTAASNLDSVPNNVLTFTTEGSTARLVGIQIDGTDLVWCVFLAEGTNAAPALS